MSKDEPQNTRIIADKVEKHGAPIPVMRPITETSPTDSNTGNNDGGGESPTGSSPSGARPSTQDDG